MNDIQVHPPTLRQASGDLQTTATQTAAAPGHWLDASFTAAGDLSGWESGAALHDCAQGWQDHIVSVTQQLQTYADQLKSSADSYEAVNQEAARRFHEALTDLNAKGQ